jgi:catechol 2,3-dioxygenase-like lactoylglutathione lyase family enzyme
MLESKEPMATVAVSKLERARKFYEDKVGLTPDSEEQEEGAIAYKCGKASLLVYESDYAGTNEATAVTWTVGDDIQKVVDDLAKNGVAFEHYDMPDAKKEGDVFVFGKLKAAWFKDPDGNIHALVNG